MVVTMRRYLMAATDDESHDLRVGLGAPSETVKRGASAVQIEKVEKARR